MRTDNFLFNNRFNLNILKKHVKSPCEIKKNRIRGTYMIQKDETKELAWVARIDVKDGDISEFQDKINKKLSYYSVLADAPTENVKKTANPSRLNTVLRKDSVTPSMSIDDALENAPDVYETSFKIPKIL